MLDITIARKDPDRIQRSALRRGLDPSLFNGFIAKDHDYRSALTTSEQRKAEKNNLTSQIAKATNKAELAKTLKPEIQSLDEQIKEHEHRASILEEELRAILEQSPNLLDDSVPDGTGEADNVVVRTWGEIPAFDFSPKPHWEVGEALGILDLERAAKLSGSRFSILYGAGVRLSRAIAQFFLDRAAAKGYTEVAPPYLVTRETMWSTGQLTKFSDAMFRDPDGLFMIPTAEVPLTALHGNEILDGTSLPRKYTAHSPCFRKEAGAAGKDTRGLIRQHQFEKVELVWLTTPETSFETLETLTRDAEDLLKELGLPHRTVALCAGDVGFNAAKTYDLEVWLPSANTYREISSCSNCTDFQARRANIRFRRESTAKPEILHTLNGSGLAIGRTLVAILENYQQSDGSIRVPTALQSYMNTKVIQRS